ncbi:MAG: 3-hydroxyacyl-CoA dehydrogenase NAD-binding domain-containing protein [Gemmatimonadaceae bacterium]
MKRIVVIGAGEIGAGWAALFAAHGFAVTVVDPDADAAQRVESALRDVRALGVGAGKPGKVTAVRELEPVLPDAEWIQEATPEALELKQSLFARVESLASSAAVIGSSTSSFTRAQLSKGMRDASRLIIVHPLHPVYAVPIVEVGIDGAAPEEKVERVRSTLRALGRDPILVRSDVAGLIANRLTAALLREALDLIARGVVDAGDLDRVIARGIALGWAARGALGTEMIGAGVDAVEDLPSALEPTLAPLWKSLASWDALDPGARRALEDTLRRSSGEMRKTHAAGESTWVKTLSRVARAAGGD